MKRVGLPFVILGVLTLSGCMWFTGEENHPFSLRLDGATVQLTSCSPIDFDYLSLEWRNLREGVPWELITELEDAQSLDSGEVIDIAAEVDAHADDEFRLFVGVASPPGYGRVASERYYVTEEWMTSGFWMDDHGTVSSHAC